MIKDGFTPRMTPKEHHDLVVGNIPSNLSEIYNAKVFDEIKIYDRKNNLLYSQEKTLDIAPKIILEREFKRKWDKQELKEYKEQWSEVIKMMEDRKAPEEELQVIKNERTNILGRVLKSK